NISRAYFTYKKQLDNGIKFRFTTDVGRISETYYTYILTTNDNGDITGIVVSKHKSKERLHVYVKYAYLDWKVKPAGTLILGQQGTNYFNIEEANWGLRFVEKAPMDRLKMATSADMGIGFKRELIDNLHFHATYVHGTGYKHPEDNSEKKIGVQLFYGQPKLTKKDGFNAGATVAIEPYDSENKQTIAAFGGFAKSGLRIGGEFDIKKSSEVDNRQQVMAAYCAYKALDNLTIFGRVDIYDSNTETKDDGNTYIIVGIDYSACKGFHMAPNIRYKSYQDGSDSEMLIKMNFEFKF
ncbi:MAG: hypothetical protein DRP89_07125, partial [Candidatus Neomarinimicrobiota bacterium]